MEHEEAGVGVDLVGWEQLHLFGGGVEVVHGEDEGVLNAVGDDDGAGVRNVALLHNELDDRR